MRPIAYYVHHHGRGHRARFEAIRASSAREIVGIGHDEDLDVRLPSDVPADAPVDPTAGGALHWAPVDVSTAAPRLRALAVWIDEAKPCGAVIDVSVEAALAFRLAGVPTLVVRQHGMRTDPPHRIGFATARRLLAPFPEQLEHPNTPTCIRRQTDYLGFVASPSCRGVANRSAQPTSSDAVVVWGAGGGRLRGPDVDALAMAIEGTVFCVGRELFAPGDEPRAENVAGLGWVDGPGPLLSMRPLVLASAGNNAVALAAQHRCPLIVAPQVRPFDEQHGFASALDRFGVAVLAPAQPEVWKFAVDAARRRADRWSELPDTVHAGPVGYLPRRAPDASWDVAALAPVAEYQDSRPLPGEPVRESKRFDLFWSLSFAVDRAGWERVGGFDERFTGYGGEDTDFAERARRAGLTLAFNGSACAFHQYHDVSSPPIEHVSSICRNATRFRDTWGWWPMAGWLSAFAELGLIDWCESSNEIAIRGES